MVSVFPDLFLICTFLICRPIFFNCLLPCGTLKAGLGGILSLDGKTIASLLHSDMFSQRSLNLGTSWVTVLKILFPFPLLLKGLLFDHVTLFLYWCVYSL